MSHIVKAKVKLKDQEAVQRAVQYLTEEQDKNIELLGEGRHKLYDGTYEGIGIKFGNWNYPIVIDPETGEIRYDNYGGSWGPQQELNDFTQRCGIESAKMAAESKGWTFDEVPLDNGDIRLDVHVGGSADGPAEGNIGSNISF